MAWGCEFAAQHPHVFWCRSTTTQPANGKDYFTITSLLLTRVFPCGNFCLDGFSVLENFSSATAFISIFAEFSIFILKVPLPSKDGFPNRIQLARSVVRSFRLLRGCRSTQRYGDPAPAGGVIQYFFDKKMLYVALVQYGWKLTLEVIIVSIIVPRRSVSRNTLRGRFIGIGFRILQLPRPLAHAGGRGVVRCVLLMKNPRFGLLCIKHLTRPMVSIIGRVFVLVQRRITHRVIHPAGVYRSALFYSLR